ncbi:hypothetical protein AVEN_154171-1 [Araneus ventricosus]|uniref:Uncharacterized protein n=1 Tax=Araneus ventricosus TaxID=182803 RepID=A0A4Y2GI29_ARAVE|nr:hypothetical protein AVEN_154171-1 [Araneus ventricosus]
MQKEEYEEWMSIDEDIPVAATLADLEICQMRSSLKVNIGVQMTGCGWCHAEHRPPPVPAEGDPPADD